ncbi:MAG TPA: tRNA (guanosine(37)-N1)-methyltransferase TrmD [Candidatus Dormibacteraeota bacterium]|nr:tRNA (guanosine(37)-N1)-methyltransferase TrmD [Candidatus Dormibacteraeota bacterium]
MLRVDVITLFPEFFGPQIALSILGRAIERGLLDVRLHHLLDALGRKERADDAPFGGGAGMVLRIEPLARVLDPLLAEPCERRQIVLFTPAGRPFDQASARRYGELEQLILICGHYEGVDERIAELYPVEEVSLGDFVLTGGEIPAMAVLDATARLLPGVISEESLVHESFEEAGLDYPVYTRPRVFRGVEVPAVLLSGDHAAIAAWRREESRRRTAARRPDLGDAKATPPGD